jgi:hypothetical protein
MTAAATDPTWREQIVSDKLHVRARAQARQQPASDSTEDTLFVLFEVRALYGRNDSGGWLFLGREEDGVLRGTADIEIADLLVSGIVKWDGCVDFNWNQEKNSLHTCNGRAGTQHIVTMFNIIFDLAVEIMPQADQYINDR